MSAPQPLPLPPRNEVTQTTGKQAYCRCWRSQSFPYCDGSHNQLPNDGQALGPVVVEVPERD